MRKEFLINIFIIFMSTTLCFIFSLFGIIIIQKLSFRQYYTNLDWDGKEIKDIPFESNKIYESRVRGTGKIFNVKINSQGFRDYEYSLNKPKNVLRIAVVGDSVTFGEGVNLEDTYAKQLEGKLNSYCNKKVEVLNFGASGASTVNELELIQKKVLLYKPDIVMLQMDPNDSNVINQIKNTDPFLNKIILRLKKSKFELSQWLKCKLEFYKYYKYRKHMTLEDEYSNVVTPLRMIIDICRENKIQLIVLSYYSFYKRSYYKNVLEFIEKKSIPLLDLAITRFAEVSGEEKFVNGSLDNKGNVIDPHPNKYGSRIIAQEIFEFLQKIPGFRNSCV